MAIDFTTTLKNLDGEPYWNDPQRKKAMTLGDACTFILHKAPGKEATDMIRRAELSEKIHAAAQGNGSVDLLDSDVTEIVNDSKMLGDAYLVLLIQRGLKEKD